MGIWGRLERDAKGRVNEGMWKEKEPMASIGNYTRIRLQECLRVLVETTESAARRRFDAQEEE